MVCSSLILNVKTFYSFEMTHGIQVQFNEWFFTVKAITFLYYLLRDVIKTTAQTCLNRQSF